MKWNHILHKQPEDGEMIIQIDQPYEGHYPMGMRKYEQKCSFEEVLKYYRNYDMKGPDFWWIKASEFPFPDQPERSKREDFITCCICDRRFEQTDDLMDVCQGCLDHSDNDE